MSFEVPLPPLTGGHIIKRYKRFLADIQLTTGEEVTAHCANTGAMTGCWEPGAPVQLSHSDNPKRKLAWSLERVDMGQGWIGIHTGRVNQTIEQLIRHNQIPGFENCDQIQREPRFDHPDHGKSRFDLRLLTQSLDECYVEIKNCTLLQGHEIRFPDAVSLRAQKHLALLEQVAQQDQRAVMLFAINRPEGDCFTPAEDVDADYAIAFDKARANGVEMMTVRIEHTDTGMRYGGAVPISRPVL